MDPQEISGKNCPAEIFHKKNFPTKNGFQIPFSGEKKITNFR